MIDAGTPGEARSAEEDGSLKRAIFALIAPACGFAAATTLGTGPGLTDRLSSAGIGLLAIGAAAWLAPEREDERDTVPERRA